MLCKLFTQKKNILQNAVRAWVCSHSMRATRWDNTTLLLLAIFQVKFEFSELLCCKQTHHPITIAVRDGHHVFPATTTSKTIAYKLLICVSQHQFANLTNKMKIIFKTTHGNVSLISWTTGCSENASGYFSCFHSITRWESMSLYPKPIQCPLRTFSPTHLFSDSVTISCVKSFGPNFSHFPVVYCLAFGLSRPSGFHNWLWRKQKGTAANDHPQKKTTLEATASLVRTKKTSMDDAGSSSCSVWNLWIGLNWRARNYTKSFFQWKRCFQFTSDRLWQDFCWTGTSQLATGERLLLHLTSKRPRAVEKSCLVHFEWLW